MGFLMDALKARFEEKMETTQVLPCSVMMISGCEDAQTSADADVTSFSLPDPAGRAGGACTAALLNVLYADEKRREDDLSFTEVLTQMRSNLQAKGYEQIPQLTSSKPIDVNQSFDLVPPNATGARRALLVGINYIGHESGVLSGCHNDVLNMVNYIKDVHSFSDENITILLDDENGEYAHPTKANMMAAYQKIVADSEPGDVIFCHYSGHGASIKDDDHREEHDGCDEVLCPVDYNEAGFIRDDDLYDTLIRPLAKDVTVTCLMDCCHSGTILDLPYAYKADGNFERGMEIDANYNFNKLFKKVGEVMESLDTE